MTYRNKIQEDSAGQKGKTTGEDGVGRWSISVSLSSSMKGTIIHATNKKQPTLSIINMCAATKDTIWYKCVCRQPVVMEYWVDLGCSKKNSHNGAEQWRGNERVQE